MSGPFKMPSFGEMMAKRKRKSKGKESSEPSQALLTQESAPAPEGVGAQSSGLSPPPKRSRLSAEEEDLDNVVIKIPRSTTIFADPSGLDQFASKLLLEADEERLVSLGPIEAMRKAVAHSFEALECGVFAQKSFEVSQKRIKELEKANTSLRKNNTELKSSLDDTEKKMKLSKAEAESSQAEATSLKEVVRNLEKEREALMEQMEGIAFEAMLKQRYDLMKQFVSGEYKDWTPERWIEEYEHGDDEADEPSTEVAPLVGGDVPAEGTSAAAAADVDSPPNV